MIDKCGKQHEWKRIEGTSLLPKSNESQWITMEGTLRECQKCWKIIFEPSDSRLKEVEVDRWIQDVL